MNEKPEYGTKSDDRYCCHAECGPGTLADFEIAGGSGHFEDFTDSCRGHVGELLGTPSWLDEENKFWVVTALRKTPDVANPRGGGGA